MIMSFGSRGDTQPFLALSMRLRDAGYVVIATCNSENVEFFGKMGIEARGVHFNFDEFLRGNPKMLKAMATSNAEAMNMGIVKQVSETYEASFDAIWEVAQEFKPDILMPGLPFDLYTAHAIGQVMMIPVIYSPLSVQATLIPCASLTTDMDEPFWHFQAGLLGLKALQWMVFKKFAQVAHKRLANELQGAPLFADSYKHMLDEMVKPSAIVLIQNSERIRGLPSDLPACYAERARPTGYWTISKESQQARASVNDSHFGGGSHAEIERFLAESPEPPVYLGWGSMVAVSPEHMADLAVRTLMLSKKRGIILGGWAKLHPGLLADRALIDYAAKNVLFVASAPHEMLFPRCSVTIHHGGMGTTVAALRSGRPTIITPVIFDQFDNARMVQESGAGCGMPAFKKITARALAEAIRLATTDEKMKTRSEELGEVLRADDGLQRAVDALDAFVRDELETGRWRAAFDETLQNRSKRPMRSLRWFMKMRSSNPFT
jgi:sterol 3beta-glucosyltransferase